MGVGPNLKPGVQIEPGNFARKLSAKLQKIDYRIPATRNEREAIYQLRYQCYRREGTIPKYLKPRLTDGYDNLENCWIFGIYDDDELLSSIRFHIISPEHPYGPALDVFPDKVMPMIEAGMTVIDPSRFVVDVTRAKRCPSIAYLTVRIVCMASEFFEVDYCLATVRPEHQTFYKRLFGFRELSSARDYPPLLKPLSLTGALRVAVRDAAAEKNPIFTSSFVERRLLFDQPKSEAEISDLMLPIAAG
jgi:hypothetical protein